MIRVFTRWFIDSGPSTPCASLDKREAVILTRCTTSADVGSALWRRSRTKLEPSNLSGDMLSWAGSVMHGPAAAGRSSRAERTFGYSSMYFAPMSNHTKSRALRTLASINPGMEHDHLS